MASESDMRKHTVLHRDNAASGNLSSTSLTPSQPHSRPGSAAGLATTSGALSAVQESGPALVVVPAPPVTPPNDGMSSSSNHLTLSASASDLFARPESPPIQDETPKHRRFSMLRFRNASDSQLATKAKQHAAAEKPPPLPRPPEIITTAPTLEFNAPQKKQPRIRLASRMRRSGEEPRTEKHGSMGRSSDPERKDRRMSIIPQDAATGKQSVTFDDAPRPKTSISSGVDGNGEDGTGALAIPGNRMSESSRSDGSSGNHQYFGSTTTTTQTTHTTTTFFRLRRKPKQPEPLFPISHLKSNLSTTAESSASNSSVGAPRPDLSMSNGSPSRSGSQRTPTTSRPNSVHDVATPPGHPAGFSFFGKSASPATALFRPTSRNSGQSSPTRAHLHLRGRSSTLSSLGRNSPRPSMDEHLAPPTTRTSTSTGRKSFGDLLGLSRMRQDSQSNGRGGNLTPVTPGSNTSKNNSLQIPRGSVVLPERRDDDTPAKYLARLEEVVSRSVIAAAVSKGTDQFSQAVLRSYMRGFSFFGDPMDMAIRKLLMEAELPKETQQIDRTLQAFANRYHECNPGIYSSAEQAYFIAFSLLILHTDVFNKNNKHKMQKADYVKNTQGEGIFQEILEVFYDNITYTPFIHVEDDLDINGERIIAHKTRKKSIFPNGSPDAAKKALKEPIDPYTLIIDGRLDILRPNLKDVMQIEDHYSYLGTAPTFNLKELQRTFFKTGILQIISARSRPDAFMTEQTATNPEGAHPGIVDIKITKVGLLWRKDPKKKKTRSPWQEWGAILTGAQLYFFRNTGWIKNLLHQYETHIKQGHDGMPVIFKPPLDNFKPDALMSTDGAVALLDTTYKKHKHAFTYVRHGGFEEVLLADNEEEMNDWLAKLNYAAAFRTSGVRMRGVVGGGYDGQGRRAIRRLDTDGDAVQTPSGEVMISRSRIDHQMVQDILAARRDIMAQKIADAEEKLEDLNKQLDLQLRNARHLQILAPIHPKTREQMLLSAAKLAAQLKWTRVDMWKIQCHRDILVSDLEEERQLLGLPEEKTKQEAPSSQENGTITPVETRGSVHAASPQSTRSPTQVALTRTSTVTVKSDDESPVTDVFQTPPTSATAASFHRHQNSWELPSLNFDRVDLRKGSVSSVISSNHSITATPPRKIRSSSSAPATEKVDTNDGDDVDADERALLEKAGLIGATQKAQADSKSPNLAADSEDGRDRHNSAISDRSKIRRSLQRTLREGAGHISHVRSRRGRDSVSSGVVPEEIKLDNNINAPDFLTRGSGSFVVHGKKASVITFGTELQSLTPDEHLRLQRNRALQAAQADGTNTSASSSSAAVTAPSAGESTVTPDYRVVLGAAARRAASRDEHERRESAASASTATARSFRELHRKYSSAQQAAARSTSASAHSMGTLTVPSDTDSEVAVSFSDGRRSPLPPIEGESEGETPGLRQNGDDSSDDEEDEEDEGRLHKRRTQFFTPDPPASPAVDGFMAGRGNGNDEESRGRPRTCTENTARPVNGGSGHGERLPSPPLQVVSA
ncbi:hypothetical protein CONLIGDRAFT_654342 [Coniochaeta ligniaria NRRL 30616]|uniref:Protein transport protein sec73 n=1 Tax=Coniochaeta ligniaria NRRL 30616 TaxID=1408157 RepID=A0A1J7J9M1_9PEZI|nr:hypothetical protein CONLIGDRAFT_654342 [Coniochaeta ligniaria NRRL 30616]